MNGIDWGALIAVIGAVVLGAIAALYRSARYLAQSGYKLTFSGPSLKVEKQVTSVPRPPAPKVVILGGNGVPDSLTSDLVVKEARF